VAIAEVEAYVMEVAESGRLRDVAYDPMRFNRSAEVLEERGLKMVEFPQTHSRMVPASNSLYDIVREGNLVHDGDPDFKRQVMAGVAAETDQGWRISKKKSRAKIDALIALALGADLAWQVEEPKRSVYEERYAAA
jgi:phage terminase large subunit-like protein